MIKIVLLIILFNSIMLGEVDKTYIECKSNFFDTIESIKAYRLDKESKNKYIIKNSLLKAYNICKVTEKTCLSSITNLKEETSLLTLVEINDFKEDMKNVFIRHNFCETEIKILLDKFEQKPKRLSINRN